MSKQVGKICYTVSELLESFNFSLENQFPVVHFRGEISEVTLRASVVYIKIKDEFSQVSALIWRSTLQQLGFELKQGQEVLCSGTPGVFARFGSLQVKLKSIELAGEGELQQRFLQLKAKLEKEGLFAADRKRALPFMPKIVGVVTSATGAVIHDIMFKIQERLPQTQVQLIDVKVQGAGSAEEIAAAIEYFNAHTAADVLIVGRGGGSLQELWSFNEEIVVRAIFSSRIPVISAVGHETDVTLADLVADRRAPTPTAAAELAVPSKKELLRHLTSLATSLQNIEKWLLPKFQHYDFLLERFSLASTQNFRQKQLKLDNAALKLARLEPSKLLARSIDQLKILQNNLQRTVQEIILRSRQELVQVEQGFKSEFKIWLVNKQHALSKFSLVLQRIDHKKILERGYLLARVNDLVVTSVEKLKLQDELKLEFFDGKASAQITKIHKDKRKK